MSDTTSYEAKHAEEKQPLLTDATYDKLKPAAALIFPALITFWISIASIWHLPYREEIAGTLGAINILLGVVLLVASNIYKKSDAKYDGVITVTEHPDGFRTAALNLKNYENPADVVEQDEAVFKVQKQ